MAIAMAMGVSGGWNYGDAMGMGWDSWYVEVHKLAAYLGRHDARSNRDTSINLIESTLDIT